MGQGREVLLEKLNLQIELEILALKGLGGEGKLGKKYAT